MKYSQLFTKTKKDAPKDEQAKNAQLLIRSGYIHKEMAGVYDLLPLGFRVIKKIEQIIREEMDAVGGQEVEMMTLQNPETWKKTNRWEDKDVDNWFRTKLQNDTELGLALTHEDPLTLVMKDHISSYRELPAYVYQFQTKFRNELRAKSGILRGREFLMKDLYSFSRTQVEHDEFYEKMKDVYARIFERVGIGEQTFLTFASGGIFSQFSHEFQTLTEAGEDTIYLSRDKKIAVNEEVYTDEVLNELGLKKDELEEVKGVEVGNIFSLGTRFSEPLDFKYTDENGAQQHVLMGSYGIGLGRLMGTVVELLSDESGIVWPESISPFDIHLVSIGDVKEEADKLYQELTDKGIEVLYDDRDESAGKKLGDADLIGISKRVVISPKTLEHGSVEVKMRNSDSTNLVKISEIT